MQNLHFSFYNIWFILIFGCLVSYWTLALRNFGTNDPVLLVLYISNFNNFIWREGVYIVDGQLLMPTIKTFKNIKYAAIYLTDFYISSKQAVIFITISGFVFLYGNKICYIWSFRSECYSIYEFGYPSGTFCTSFLHI